MGLIFLFHQPTLFQTARGLLAAGHTGPAVVIAQAAVEVTLEAGIDHALTDHASEELKAWVTGRAARGRAWSPTNNSVQGLWEALTGERLTTADSWGAYREGIEARHTYVHRGKHPSTTDAEAFIDAAEKVARHIEQVVAAAGSVE